MTACHILASIELEGIYSSYGLKVFITIKQELLYFCNWIFEPNFRILFLFTLSIISFCLLCDQGF